MTDDGWQMADGRWMTDLPSSVICHPSSSRHLDRRGGGVEAFHRVPQKVAVAAVVDAVRGIGQDDLFAVAIGELGEEIEEIRVGRVAVPFAADARDAQARRAGDIQLSRRSVGK
jgi:hypothetical protein